MSAFHAAFSLGGVAAALAGARTLSWGWTAPTTLTTVAVLGTVAGLLAAPALLPTTPTGGPIASSRQATPRRIWLLAVLAFLLMLCEGVANDWSVLAMRDAFGAPTAVAALAYGAYATAMTTGRLLADRVVGRLGPVMVLRFGACLAAAGLTSVVLAPTEAVALIGWTLFGLGLSGCIPQLFSAAGHFEPATAGANISHVASLGYLGMLAGPAIIGPLTRLAPLTTTFLLPVAFCAIAATTAGILRTDPVSAAATRDRVAETV